ncbi:hypothetical protein [Listeria aquatica]|uniref:hypothetical protein n=1 Tax=Listeria aquatica TaxID=1494960 RepID=UPI0031F59837
MFGLKVKMGELEFKRNKLFMTFDIKKSFGKSYEYAYYIYQDDQITERIWYQEAQANMRFSVMPIYSGSYQIRLFIKENGEIIFNELSNLLWIDAIHKKQIETTFPKEKVFFSDNPVKYVFQKAKKESRYLILSFSGLYSTEFRGGPPVYNHMRTLTPVETHKLFILDSYLDQFCYYVGFGGEEDFERSVIALITMIANEYQIPPENIIATGSSKGGAAALYYSFKYHFGKAVIGAPQVYIAKYLDQRANSDSMRQRYNRLLGNDLQFGKLFWDGLILNQIARQTVFPELHFHVGEGDFHYSQHLKPLFKLFNEKKINYTLDLGKYEKHSDTGLYFTSFLLEKVQEIVMRKEERS